MSGYNRFERAVGRVLDRVPRVKTGVEAAYQRANYYLYADRGFECDLHDDVTIESAAAWAGADPGEGRFVGFYDICPWDQAMKRYVVHEVDGNETGIVVLGSGEARRVATTSAWNYQQGSRTHWHPNRPDSLLFNDVVDGEVGARVESVNGSTSESYPHPVQVVHPEGTEYLSLDYRRLGVNSPAYGYGVDDESGIASPENDGIRRVTFDGHNELLVTFADLIDSADTDVHHTRHYVHHALYAPGGERFAFLHRWMDGNHRNTRLYVADADGETRLLVENRQLSHYCWLDDDRLFLWGGSAAGEGYQVLDVTTGEASLVDDLADYGDGHPSLSPDGSWFVFDTYPDRLRKRTLTLYHRDTGRTVPVGEFLAPFGFDGATRCDLHPRWSPDGTMVSIDSAHDGIRRSYVLDVSAIVSD